MVRTGENIKAYVNINGITFVVTEHCSGNHFVLYKKLENGDCQFIRMYSPHKIFEAFIDWVVKVEYTNLKENK